jgi:hypothetical protein
MADLRRPNRPGSNNAQGRTPGRSQGRGSQSRRPQPARAPTPRWVIAVMLVVPLIGIGVLGTVKATKKAPEVQPAPVVVDPNVRLNELTQQVRDLESQLKKLPLRSENPSDKAKVDDYKKRLIKWRDEWDALFADKLDLEGNIKPEYRGYMGPRNKVNQLINDLNRVTGF